jgi:undecaprenyl diphosphate synthase
MVKYNKIKHVCFIADGHRSFILLNNFNINRDIKDVYKYAYKSGAKALEKTIKMTFDRLHIRYLTTNAISRENCIKRSLSGKTIASLIPYLFKERMLSYFIKNMVRVKFVGDIDLICSMASDPDKLRKTIAEIEQLTSKFNKYNLIILTAFDPVHEYLKLMKNNKKDTIDKKILIRRYYGFDVPQVDFLIRTWWPRYSIIPILVGEHADIYLFPAPMQAFKEKHYVKITKDYMDRITSTDSGDAYIKGVSKNLSSIKTKILSADPLLTGIKINGVWMPFSK